MPPGKACRKSRTHSASQANASGDALLASGRRMDFDVGQNRPLTSDAIDIVIETGLRQK